MNEMKREATNRDKILNSHKIHKKACILQKIFKKLSKLNTKTEPKFLKW